MPRRVLLLLAVLVIAAAVLPRLTIDYGLDGDSVRNAGTARTLHTEGRYVPNRLPGNPLHDYLLALLLPWGKHYAANSLSLVSFILAVAGFFRLMRGHPCAVAWGTILALTPILLVNAVVTMDYMLGLALAIWAYERLTKGRDAFAYLLTGLAIACRLSNALLLVAFGGFLLARRCRWSRIAGLTLFGLLTGLVFYVPIFRQTGMAMFKMPPGFLPTGDRILLTGFNGINLFGVPGTVALVVVLLVHGVDICRSWGDSLRGRSPDEAAEWTAVVLFVTLFVIHPDESEYLLPIVPFLYLLCSRWLSKSQVAFVGVLVGIVSVFDVGLVGGTSGQRTIVARPAWGIVVADYRDRKGMEFLRRHAGDYAFREPAVVMTGLGGLLTYENDRFQPEALRLSAVAGSQEPLRECCRWRGRDVFFVYALSRAQCQALKEAGYSLYMFSTNAPTIARHKSGYTPDELGIEVLPASEGDVYCAGVFSGSRPKSQTGR
jgi:hypothetical protein